MTWRSAWHTNLFSNRRRPVSAFWGIHFFGLRAAVVLSIAVFLCSTGADASHYTFQNPAVVVDYDSGVEIVATACQALDAYHKDETILSQCGGIILHKDWYTQGERRDILKLAHCMNLQGDALFATAISSPHMEWLSKVLEANGGLLLFKGQAEECAPLDEMARSLMAANVHILTKRYEIGENTPRPVVERFPVDSTLKRLVVVVNSFQLEPVIRLISPDGTEIQPKSRTYYQSAYDVPSPNAGEWKIQIQKPGDYVVKVSAAGSELMRLSSGLHAHKKGDVSMSVKTEGANPAGIVTRIVKMGVLFQDIDQQLLMDDGRSADGEPGDGVYGTRAKLDEGLYGLRIRGTFELPDGTKTRREILRMLRVGAHAPLIAISSPKGVVKQPNPTMMCYAVYPAADTADFAARVDNKECKISSVYRSDMGNLQLARISFGAPYNLSEGRHRVEVSANDGAGNRMGAHKTEFVVDLPASTSILINEIRAAGLKSDFVELAILKDGLDLSDYTLGDLNGKPTAIASRSLKVGKGEYVLLRFTEGRTEYDDVGDVNGNGIREVYVPKRFLSTTDDQLVLYRDKAIVDAVAYSDGNNRLDKYEIADLRELTARGEWDTSGEMVLLGQEDESIGRKTTVDTNKKSDWQLYRKPTPGRSNDVLGVAVSPEHVPLGAVVINELHPNTPGIPWAELYCVNGPLDISDFVLTDLDGRDQKLALKPVTLKTGQFAAVWWKSDGADEIDGVGDANGNGSIDLYVSDAKPATTNDQLVLMLGRKMYDAIAWTNEKGSIDTDELEDVDEISNQGMWSGENLVRLGTQIQSLGRMVDGKDANTSNDWGRQIIPTPGKPNKQADDVQKGSILIETVYPHGEKTSYAVLQCLKGPINVSSLILTDMSGVDNRLADRNVTLQTGEKVVVRWYLSDPDELDGVGDPNHNGVRDLYCPEPGPSATDDLLVLKYGDEILDAVAWTNSDGQIAATKLKKMQWLVSTGEWKGTYADITDQISSVNIKRWLYKLAIHRINPSQDSNSKDDWKLAEKE